MSEQPDAQPERQDRHPVDEPPDALSTDGSGPLEDVPAAAGGTDDGPPAQGEGERDSW